MPKAETTAKKSTKKAAPKKKENASTGFAVIATGGKQYKASLGESIKIEKLKGEYAEGDSLSFDKVLLVDNGTETTLGTPYVSGAKVEGKLTKIGRAQKVIVVKYKQKSRYYKKNGHRQPFFQVEITGIK
jgi:large subunit ribosomal protein L21